MGRRGLLCLALCLGAGGGQAGRLELAAGAGSENLDAARLAWQQTWDWQRELGAHGTLSGYHALSINHWWNSRESITALAYSPVFTWQRHRSPWYLRFGIGAAYLSETQIAGRVLSTRFQFEDQLGIGWRRGRHDLALVYLHYSNAGIDKPNQGIDLLLFAYGLSLD